MQVFQDQQQRHLDGQGLDPCGHLAEHAGLRGAEEFVAQGLVVSSTKHPGHLDQPRQRVRTQQCQEMVLSRGAA